MMSWQAMIETRQPRYNPVFAAACMITLKTCCILASSVCRHYFIVLAVAEGGDVTNKNPSYLLHHREAFYSRTIYSQVSSPQSAKTTPSSYLGSCICKTNKIMLSISRGFWFKKLNVSFLHNTRNTLYIVYERKRLPLRFSLQTE
jgi:hypothetical protein